MVRYKYSLPIMNNKVNESTRAEYLRLMRSAGIDRVFLCVCELWEDTEVLSKNKASLKENIKYFNENGIEAAIWIGETVGHGSVLSHDIRGEKRLDYTPLMTIDGEEVGGTRCPADPRFRKDVSEFIMAIARDTGAKLILLDDDLRISFHGNNFCCACDRHMEMIRQRCGEDISREEIYEKVFASEENKYRAAYLDAMGDSIRDLARDIRAKMDEYDSTVRIGICSAPNSWDFDGTNAIDISKLLAGKTKPLLRTSGAPYWSRSLSFVLEITRMYGSFCENEDIETMAEGDVYPRPRYIVPASKLEIYDAVIGLTGYNGILKYMMDYNTSPFYDQSYIKHHIKNKATRDGLCEIFSGKSLDGVRVYSALKTIPNADFTLSTPSYYHPSAISGMMLQQCGIPTVYGNDVDAGCLAIFGENARHIPLDFIKNGAILDGAAATILTERGIDVGLRGERSMASCKVALMNTPDEQSLYVNNGDGKYITTETDESVCVLATAMIGGKELPLAYSYKNPDGIVFTVFTFEALSLNRTTGIAKGYAMEKIFKEAYEEISGGRLPAHCDGAPELYTLCGRGKGSLAVGLFNYFADPVLDPVIKLDKNYSKIRFIGCDGELCGDTVKLCDIQSGGFVGFEVTD